MLNRLVRLDATALQNRQNRSGYFRKGMKNMTDRLLFASGSFDSFDCVGGFFSDKAVKQKAYTEKGEKKWIT